MTSAPGSLPDCDDGTHPSTSMGVTNLVNESELIACLAGFTVAGYPDGDPSTCTWTTTPSKPGASSRETVREERARIAAQEQQFAFICQSGLADRLCAPYASQLPEVVDPRLVDLVRTVSPVMAAAPAASRGRLSSFTCSWWRRADDPHRHGMVQRIRSHASARVNGGPGDADYGYGAYLTDNDAALVFEDRCSMFQAGPFALYKIYGAAAAFASAG